MHAAERLRRWCVFCGSSPGHDPQFRELATAVGAFFARAGIEVVYGGGNVGLMGLIADSAIDAGGTVIGIIPHALAAREAAHERLTRLELVDTMHDGFLMLPGGFGTFEEFCEVVTWVQLGIIAKPCVILNAGGYYDPLLAMFDRAHTSGFISTRNRTIVHVVDSVDALSDCVSAYERT
jgi:uncharacterized protein (TIGR00730 family)